MEYEVGKNAEDNWRIVKESEDNWLWFHLNSFEIISKRKCNFVIP